MIDRLPAETANAGAQQSPDTRPRIYLLRCWHEAGHHPPPDDGWRFSLEDPHSGLRRGYPNLPALVAALEQATVHRPLLPIGPATEPDGG